MSTHHDDQILNESHAPVDAKPLPPVDAKPICNVQPTSLYEDALSAARSLGNYLIKGVFQDPELSDPISPHQTPAKQIQPTTSSTSRER
jgi:hypothetical protein